MNRILAIIATLALAVQSWAASITCTFTAADNTLLEDYVNGAEATWTEIIAGGNIQVSDSNRVHTTTTTASFYYIDNFTPASMNYDVECQVTFKSVPTTTVEYLGIGGRATSTTALSGYTAWLKVSSGVWQISIARPGATTLQTVNIPTPSVNDVKQFKLSMRDHTLLAYWDGVLVNEYHVDTGSSNYKTDVGFPTLYYDGSSSHLTDATGPHVDNFTVTDAAAVSTTGTDTVVASELWYNGMDGTGNPKQHPFAEWKFTSNAQIITVTATTDEEDDYPTYNNMGLWVDGTWMSPNLSFTANGSQSWTFYLQTTLNAEKTFRFVGSLHSNPTDEPYPQGSYIESIELKSWFDPVTYTLIPPSDYGKLLVYGDSISVGAFAGVPNKDGWACAIRNLWDRNVMVEGHGFRALSDDCWTSGTRQTFAEELVSYNAQYLWICIGTNDYAGVPITNDFNATTFGTAYADLLDKLHAEDPELIIFCQSPLSKFIPPTDTLDEGDIGGRGTMADYRSAISAAAAARSSYCIYVDGAPIVQYSRMSDGLHPDTEGHRIYAEFVHNTVWKTKISGANSTKVGATGITIVK